MISGARCTKMFYGKVEEMWIFPRTERDRRLAFRFTVSRAQWAGQQPQSHQVDIQHMTKKYLYTQFTQSKYIFSISPFFLLFSIIASHLRSCFLPLIHSDKRMVNVVKYRHTGKHTQLCYVIKCDSDQSQHNTEVTTAVQYPFITFLCLGYLTPCKLNNISSTVFLKASTMRPDEQLVENWNWSKCCSCLCLTDSTWQWFLYEAAGVTGSKPPPVLWLQVPHVPVLLSLWGPTSVLSHRIKDILSGPHYFTGRFRGTGNWHQQTFYVQVSVTNDGLQTAVHQASALCA